MWATASLEEVATLKGHNAYVNAVAFSPDGAYLASKSYDYVTKLWNVPDFKEVDAKLY